MQETREPIIMLPGVEGNQPMTLTATQELMIEHIDVLMVFWWSLWLLTAFYLIYTYLAKPLYQKFTLHQRNNQNAKAKRT